MQTGFVGHLDRVSSFGFCFRVRRLPFGVCVILPR